MTSEKVIELVDRETPELISQLRKLVEIPSISALANHESDVEASAETVKTMFTEIGIPSRVVRAKNPDGTLGRPAVLGRKIVDPDAPTVLLYAHHDVQPIGEEYRWSFPPLELTESGDRLYGRGSADCGIGIVVHWGALKALGDDLPVNVVVFIEGEEEIGSPSFTDFLATYRDELRSDVIVVADSNNWTVDVPALTSSLRGLAGMDVTVKVLDHAVHSGMYGGPILDAVTLSARLIASLHDEQGNITVEGLQGNPEADVDWDEDEFRSDAGVVDGYHLAGTGDLAARVWTQPAIAVIGMDVRPVAESSNTIAPECTFRLSVRTVPGTDPEDTFAAVKAHIEKHCPFGAHLTVSRTETGPGYLAANGDAADLFRDCLKTAWKQEPVSIGVGGSIPFIAQFQSEFPEAEVLVTGVEDPASNAHSENESASKTVLRNATVAEGIFLARLATTGSRAVE